MIAAHQAPHTMHLQDPGFRIVEGRRQVAKGKSLPVEHLEVEAATDDQVVDCTSQGTRRCGGQGLAGEGFRPAPDGGLGDTRPTAAELELRIPEGGFEMGRQGRRCPSQPRADRAQSAPSKISQGETKSPSGTASRERPVSDGLVGALAGRRSHVGRRRRHGRPRPLQVARGTPHRTGPDVPTPGRFGPGLPRRNAGRP
jgi:hypothetical protein